MITLARLDWALLPTLGAFRTHPGIEVYRVDHTAWLRLQGRNPALENALRALPGSELFFTTPTGEVHRAEGILPIFDLPTFDSPQRLDQVIFLARFESVTADLKRPEAVPITLVPCDLPRPTIGVRVSWPNAREWIEEVDSWSLRNLRCLVVDDDVWLTGTDLSGVPTGVRFWGKRVWSPLGWEPSPCWPEEALRQSAKVATGEILVLLREEIIALPESAFEPLQRGRLRRMLHSA